MYRAVFTWWCNFTKEAGKTRRVYHIQHDLCQAFHNYAASRPCHTYVGRMKVKTGTTLPPISRHLYVLAVKSTHNSKSNEQFLNQRAYVLNWMLKITFCFKQMSCQQRNKLGVSNGFSNMPLFMLWSQKIGYSNTIIFQEMFYDNVVYKLLHPLIFWSRILLFSSLKEMPCCAIEM